MDDLAEKLEAIVRDLAAQECEVCIPTSSLTDETANVCITCDAVFEGVALDSEGIEWIHGPTDHDEACPWRRAKAWTDANPA